MNDMSRVARAIGDMGVLDVLLADIAIRVQLSPSDHAKAISRYETMAQWIDRAGSPLQGRVGLVYPQGSMSIGATVARYSDRDEFDIDLMAPLTLPAVVSPRQVLDALHIAIRGEKGSRYWGKTERRTRCVTVFYEDGMHLDVTPAERRKNPIERESDIFHSKPEDPKEPEQRIVANPFGFGEWFKAQTPADDAFGIFIEKRSLDFDRQLFAKAETDPVPDHVPAFRKSKAVIALQLMKRWRNMTYDRRKDARRPPSILMSWSVATNANKTASLFDELVWQALALLTTLQQAERRGILLHIANPVCPADVLTDRWPASRADQQLFIADLIDFGREMEALRRSGTPAEMQPILERLFGERPTTAAVRSYFDRAGQATRAGRGLVTPGTGRIPAATAGLSLISPTSRVAPRHSFFGE